MFQIKLNIALFIGLISADGLLLLSGRCILFWLKFFKINSSVIPAEAKIARFKITVIIGLYLQAKNHQN